MNNIIDLNQIKKMNRKIILEIALLINKELFNEERISYKVFKCAEESILKQIKLIN